MAVLVWKEGEVDCGGVADPLQARDLHEAVCAGCVAVECGGDGLVGFVLAGEGGGFGGLLEVFSLEGLGGVELFEDGAFGGRSRFRHIGVRGSRRWMSGGGGRRRRVW